MSIHSQPHQALAGLVLVTPDIDIWGGSVTFDPRSQLSETARNELPPHELATNGRLHLIPTGAHRKKGAASPLAPLTSLRKAVHRRIQSIGFPFLGSVAIPQSEADTVLKDLQGYEQEFQDAVNALLGNLPALFAQRQQEYPQWSEVLKQHQPEPSSLRSRFRFLVHLHGIAVPEGSQAAAHCQTTATEALPALLASIATSASEQIEKSFTDRSVEVTQKAITPIRHLIAKLDAFSCVDSKVGQLVTLLQEQIASLPRTGPLNPAQATQAVAVLTLMANPQHMLVFGAQHTHASPVLSTPQPVQMTLQVPANRPAPAVTAPAPTPPQPAPAQYAIGL